jgi:phosphoribosylformylglycinamidine cyclo-ligase
MEPTRIYIKSVLSLIQSLPVKGIAHITGGGLSENIPRTLPEGVGAELDLNHYTLPPVFEWLRQQGNIADDEMLRTFNCGVGLTIVVSEENAQAAIDHLNSQGEQAFVLGKTTSLKPDSEAVSYLGKL